MRTVKFLLFFIVSVFISLTAVFLSGAEDAVVYKLLYKDKYEIGYVADFQNDTADIVDLDDNAKSYNIPETILCKDESGTEHTLKTVSVTNLYEGKIKTRKIYIPKTVKTIQKKGVGYQIVEGKTEKIENYTIICIENSKAEKYADKNAFLKTVYKDISKAKITLEYKETTFSGKTKKPEVTVTVGGKELKQKTDYKVAYSNNINKGTAVVTLTGKGDYRLTKTKSFKILSQNIQNPVITYKQSSNKLTVKSGKTTLKDGTDYIYTVKNADYQTRSITVKFIGNYSGKASFAAKNTVASPENITVTQYPNNTVLINWSSYNGVNPKSYQVYVFNSKKGKFQLAKALSGKTHYCKLTDCVPLESNIVKITAKSKNGKESIGSEIEAVSSLPTPTLKLKKKDDCIKLTWTKYDNIDGYELVRYTCYNEKFYLSPDNDFSDGVLFFDASTTSFKDESLFGDFGYMYLIRTVKVVNGKTCYGEYGGYCTTLDTNDKFNKAKGSSKTDFYIYNTQGKKTTKEKYTLTRREIEILKGFEKSHFTKGMTLESKLRFTLYWIQNNLEYVTGLDFYSVSSSFVEAAFVQKKGQCAQYNGAFVAMMTYLGIDARLILSYRGDYDSGNYWQHFWGEAKINGKTYLFETGNYGSNGTWHHFMTPYKYTSGYIKNGKNM